VEDFEKLGVFYLGKQYDLQARQAKEGLLLYESRDLLTHGVCIGMTGSGKTGLCLGLLEEAAIDHIPVIAIDPKGDLSNLLLTFPNLKADDFLPWINLDDARRKGLTAEAYAAAEAESWQRGLAQWGQSGARIKMLQDSAEFAIYTPGSTAGLPVSIMKSFAAPAPELLSDSDALRDKINAAATSLLALLGIEADPLKSREHILIANILSYLWKQGIDLTLPKLIEQIQNPPFTQIGAFALESFFPAKERFELAMSLNNLLAAPGFEAWLQGDALDIDRILYTEGGEPRISIFSISHLNDSERMFFVSLLLSQIVAWMRSQSGTTSLRAIVFMDEIYGFFPPVANPPTKQPLLTLLKQARAFGVGVLLASQNPVDLDYKGLSNTGTWFIGRLQTERDKMRLLDGLEGAAATAGSQFDRQKIDQLLSQLGNRVFLMNNVHDQAPTLFQTRWTLSYLRGPLSRDQIKKLAAPMKELREEQSAKQQENNISGCQPKSAESSNAPHAAPQHLERQVLAPGVVEYFLPVNGNPPAGSRLIYSPMILASAVVRFTDAKADLDTSQEITYLVPIAEGEAPVWSNAIKVKLGAGALDTKPESDSLFGKLPAAAAQAASYKAWNKDLAGWLYANQKAWLLKSTVFGAISKANESERDFRIRLSQLAREQRDSQVAKLRAKYEARINTVTDRLRRAQQAAELEEREAADEQIHTAISVGTTILGAFMGRRRSTTLDRATTAARGVGRVSRKQQEAQNARENMGALQSQLAELEQELKDEISQLDRKYDAQNSPLETMSVSAKKTNISIKILALAWVPNWLDQQGKISTGWR
jgi:hypothetical protein